MHSGRHFRRLFALTALSVLAPGVSAEPKPSGLFAERITFALIEEFPSRPPTAKPVPAPPTPSDAESPDDEVIVLPRAVVRYRPPVFNDRALFKGENLARLAAQRHLSPFHNRFLSGVRLRSYDLEYALMQYEAKEQKQFAAKLHDSLLLHHAAGEKFEATKLETELKRPFTRRDPFASLPGKRHAL